MAERDAHSRPADEQEGARDDADADQTVEKLRRQQAALVKFGRFALNGNDLLTILTEAARICAASLDVPFCKVCRYRPAENDLLIEAGFGWISEWSDRSSRKLTRHRHKGVRIGPVNR